MPIANVRDAVEVERRLDDILDEDEGERRVGHIRTLFVETLDWQYADGLIPLHNARNENLPSDAHLIASRDGASAVYIPLTDAETDRVTTAAVNAAARSLNDTLAGDLLLLFTNQTGDQFHIIRPDLTQARPRLQRMVARRWEHHRTVVQQLANMWDDYGRNGQSVHQAIASAFSVEPVTELFFNEYRRIFGNAKNGISGFTDERELHLFTQTLFNRLMFVYFISRKGWLKLNGDTDYVNALWHAYRSDASQSNFYTTRLQSLFFSGLNNPQAGDLSKNNPVLYSLIGDVEFLNGGLFEKGSLDGREGVIVPDGVIEPILNELFDRFNFTVTESTPYDTEVAVDPEMLGKVFEELVNERHESGAYYTPRPVVSFMCREALKGYIASRHPELDADSIAAFVDDGRGDVLPRSIKASVATSLDEVTTVDPACGSGAYLLGMLQELISLRDALFNESGEADPRDEYQRKLHIISRNLYGADIDNFAVNIAMLRLWLSLVIEYEGDKPDPLPNLDFKIACGDSLLAPDPDPQQYGDFTAHLMRESEVAKLKAKYMRARTRDDKDRLRDKISEAQEQIEDTIGDAAKVEGAIDWRVEFAEVMGNGGFDIVVANPPYVRHEKINSNVKTVLRKLYGDSTAARADLYCYFYVRALQLLRDGGMHVFVCSNTWLDATFGANLQNYLLEKASVRAIYESAVERQFSTAAINTIISTIEKVPRDEESRSLFISLQDEFQKAVSNPQFRRELSIDKRTLQDGMLDVPDDRGRRKLVGGKWGGKYLRAPDIYHKFMEKRKGKRLGDFVRGERYLNTGGADGFFVIRDFAPNGPGMTNVTIRSKEGKEWGSPEFRIESKFLRPGYRRTDSPNLLVKDPDCVILAISPETEIRQYEVAKYISWGEKAGFDKRSVTKTLNPWWRPSLQAQSGALILWPRTHSDAHRCFYNPRGLISLRFFRLHPKFDEYTLPILAVLNSTLFALLKEVHGRRGLGQGALETGLVDILPLEFPDLRTASISDNLSSAIRPLLDRDVGKINEEINKPDRRTLDEVVLDSFGLRPEAREEIYVALGKLLENRQRRARSV